MERPLDEKMNEANEQANLPMPSKLKMVIICLRISTVLYVTLAIVSIIFIPELIIGIILCIVSIACAVGVEVVIHGLSKYKSWGWIAGLAVSFLYIPSLFVVLGGLGVWGLLDKEVKSRFPGIT